MEPEINGVKLLGTHYTYRMLRSKNQLRTYHTQEVSMSAMSGSNVSVGSVVCPRGISASSDSNVALYYPGGIT